MNRNLFAHKSGYRLVRGSLINKLQSKLKLEKSFDGAVDGIFGDDCEKAVENYQAQNKLKVTGAVTGEMWTELFHSEPSLLERCLQLTGDFEGHSFEKAVGNFDGAGVSWGIIGFNFKSGTLKDILNRINESKADILIESFGDLTDELRSILPLSSEEQINWADSISEGENKYSLKDEWKDSFKRLGEYSEVQNIQLQFVKKYWEIAERDTRKFNLNTELAYALCFDIAVQNGGIGEKLSEKINESIAAKNAVSQFDIRKIIVDVVADSCIPRWREDVRNRKSCIATGEGNVHGAAYLLELWGLSDAEVSD